MKVKPHQVEALLFLEGPYGAPEVNPPPPQRQELGTMWDEV